VPADAKHSVPVDAKHSVPADAKHSVPAADGSFSVRRHGGLTGAFFAWPLLALAVGCAGLKLPEPPAKNLLHRFYSPNPVENVTDLRQQRTEEAVGEFEQKQDFAEFQAALARWNRHDIQGCRQGLLRLLQRNANHRDARLLLAEVYLSGNQMQEAFSQVEQALQVYPDDPRVQYTMGLLLDAVGQNTGALAYYERAAMSEPDNELYAVSYHTALSAAEQAKATYVGNSEPVSRSPGGPPQLTATVPDPTARVAGPVRLPACGTAAQTASPHSYGTASLNGPLRLLSCHEGVQPEVSAVPADAKRFAPVSAVPADGKRAAGAGCTVSVAIADSAVAVEPDPVSAAVQTNRTWPSSCSGRLRSGLPVRRPSTAFWVRPTIGWGTTSHPKPPCDRHFRWTSRVPCPTF